MVFLGYSSSDPAETAAPGPWAAPTAMAPLRATVRIPGSKSLTNRELVLAALAAAPSTLYGALDARDTRLMSTALRELGAHITREGDILRVYPADELHGAVTIDCGLAGTVMRFVPPLAALALGPVTFDGDAAARKRPMAGILDGLRSLGVHVRGDRLPFTVQGFGEVEGGDLDLDASASSQFVSGLLLAAPRFAHGLTLHHTGASLPSLPHIEMTLAVLRAHGVAAHALDERTWRVEPGPITGGEIVIEPDLSNAAPFLLATVVAGGEVAVPNWPAATTQVGDLLRELLPRFGATVEQRDDTLYARAARGILGGERPAGVDLDLHAAGELAPNLAGLAALCGSPSRLRGIGHLRGHETNRLAALVAELRRLGGDAEETEDGLVIRPAPLHGGLWECYGDHRMATTGALVGLAVPGVQLDDIATTGKTLPEFAAMWQRMLAV